MDAAEALRGRLRADNGVQLVEPEVEGTAASETPHGSYGFTGSPGLAAPLFRERRYRNFEIHHLPDGSVAIVGFMTVADRTRLDSATEPTEVILYPDLESDATEIVAIAYGRIAQHRQYSILNQPAMRFRVYPELATV
jgi:hypothetical protein